MFTKYAILFSNLFRIWTLCDYIKFNKIEDMQGQYNIATHTILPLVYRILGPANHICNYQH